MVKPLTAAELKAIAEAKARTTNALALFRPLPHQEKWLREMSLPSVMECLLSGGNRAGKSVIVAAWLASILTDKPIIFESGEEFHCRPRHWAGQPLLVWGIGRNWKHVGETMYRLLFKTDAFKIIRDEVTGKWRAYNAVTDIKRKKERKPAPAFIHSSLIEKDSWNWENKKAKELHSVTLAADGTRLVFYPSTADVAQGNPVHIIWVDESIENDNHYAEWLMRISEYEGKIVWTTWPTTAPSPAMINLKDRGESQRGNLEPTALFYQFLGTLNPHAQTAHREAALDTMSIEERSARDAGTFMMDGWLMYPRFSRLLHTAVPEDPDRDDKLAKAIREANGIPPDWTRYLALDPGTAHPAALLLAVPPPWEFGDYVVPYQEFYPGRADADQLAAKIRRETPGQEFETFIADYRAAKQVTMGMGFSVADNYSRAFRDHGLRSYATGSSFLPGIDVPEIRIGMLVAWMTQRPNGTYKLRILQNQCPVLCEQLERYRRQAGTDKKPTDKPGKSQQIDVATCLEYIAGYQPTHIRREKDPVVSPGMSAWTKFISDNSTGVKGNTVNCGPGAYGA